MHPFLPAALAAALSALSALIPASVQASVQAATAHAATASDGRTPAPDAALPSHPATILVFTRTLGWRHDSIPQTVQTLRALAAESGLAVVHSEDPALFDDASLARFAAVAFANTTGEVLDAPQRAAFERYIAAGGGFLGVHSAADTGHAWPWYGDLVGAWFVHHPPGLQTTGVHFEGGHGPDGLQRWAVTDELYDYHRNPRDRVTVIATVDESGYEGGRMGADHPIAWCHTRAGGRAWYTGLGHDPAIYADPVYRAHLRRGLRYATGLSDAC